MPPIYVDVLHTEVLSDSDGYSFKKHYIRGHHPHLGKYNPGWSGHETIVFREVLQTEEGEVVRLKKDIVYE